MDSRIDRYTDQSFLGILSEMGFFRSLYRNGMDVCPCICTDFSAICLWPLSDGCLQEVLSTQSAVLFMH